MTEIKSLVRKGTIGELKVMTILLEKGWEVFTNICDDSGVDLVIKKQKNFISVQIKRATCTSKAYGCFNRASFRLGESNQKPDFVICEYKNRYWVIPMSEINTKAFQIYTSQNSTSKYNKFHNSWQLLDHYL